MRLKEFLLKVKDYIYNFDSICDTDFNLWRKPWEESDENTIIFVFDEKYIPYIGKGIIISDKEEILKEVNNRIKILIKSRDVFFILLDHYSEDFSHTLKPEEEYIFIENNDKENYQDAVIYGPAIIHKTSTIGKSIIKGPVYIGKNVYIGHFTSIGFDGFGIYRENIIQHKGGVYIDDNVYISNQCNIDKATVGWTMIGKGTKIDAMVHIAHNVYIGKNVVIAGQSGIAGSTIIKDNVLIGGQTGILEGLIIGNNVKIGGKSKVTRDIKDNMFIVGNPAREIKKWSR